MKHAPHLNIKTMSRIQWQTETAKVLRDNVTNGAPTNTAEYLRLSSTVANSTTNHLNMEEVHRINYAVRLYNDSLKKLEVTNEHRQHPTKTVTIAAAR